MPELSNYAVCYEAIQRVYRNAIIHAARRALVEAYGDAWLSKVKPIFQREWDEVVDAANEVRVAGGLEASLIDDFDCLGVNHFHNLFATFLDFIVPRDPSMNDRLRGEQRKAILRLAKQVSDYRNAMSHPSEVDMPARDARRLIDWAYQLLRHIDQTSAALVLEYETRLLQQESAPPPGLPNRRRRSVGEDEVLIVAADRFARDDYHMYGAYICQPNRTFRDVRRMAFYSGGKILRYIPRIKGIIESVRLNGSGIEEIRKSDLDPAARAEAEALLNAILRDKRLWTGRGNPSKFVLLSGPDDGETIRLRHEIPNNKRDFRGRPTAFTQGARYVSLATLQRANLTSELE